MATEKTTPKSSRFPHRLQKLSSRDLKGRRYSTSRDATSPTRAHRAISTITSKMKTFLGWNDQTAFSRASFEIPDGLSEEELGVYRILDGVLENRHERGQKPSHVVVITDLAKDYDDLSAMVVVKEYHRLGLIILDGFIANLDPAQERAQFGRGALDKLGLPNVPIAVGSKGTDKGHTPYEYEFEICDFMERKKIVTETGEQLLLRLYKRAELYNYKIKVLLTSSLRDIDSFVRQQPELFIKFTSEVVMQGGCKLLPDNLKADPMAANNNFDIDSADRFHEFLYKNKIKSTSYTKVATFATPITSGLFMKLADDGHPVGVHLRKVQALQDFEFYSQAENEDPSQRFRDWMDAKWYLSNKTDWFRTHSEADPYPKGKEVIPYLTRVTAYDALPAVGSAGDDVLDALDILTRDSNTHECVGVEDEDGTKHPGLNGDRMSLAICTLMRGSLLASIQNLPSPSP